jgi:hypothetical protein
MTTWTMSRPSDERSDNNSGQYEAFIASEFAHLLRKKSQLIITRSAGSVSPMRSLLPE